MIAAFLSVCGGLCLLVVVALRRERAMERDWAAALSPELSHAYQDLRDRLAGERTALAFTYGRAASVGDSEEAVRLLGLGYDYLAELIPERVQLLRGLAVYSRMVSSIAPAPVTQRRLFALRRSARALLRRGSNQGAAAARASVEAWGGELDRLVRAIAAAAGAQGVR